MSKYTPPTMYERHATVLKVVDGDTLHVACNLGLDITINMTLRLYGIDCPELPTPEGIAARDFVSGWLGDHVGPYALRTVKDRREKYGRYLADLIALDGSSLCADLLSSGNAVVYLP